MDKSEMTVRQVPLSSEKTTNIPFQFSLRSLMIFVTIIAFCCGMLTWVIRSAKESMEQTDCRNHLKCLHLGLDCYHNSYQSYPPAVLYDENGKAAHTWRVFMIPFWLDYEFGDGRPLHDFSQAWNSSKNQMFDKSCNDLFKCPSDRNQDKPFTNYVAVVGEDTMWPPNARIKFNGRRNSHSETILLIELPDSSIHWMEPRDPTVEEFMEKIKSPIGKGIRCIHPHGLNYVTVGGEFRSFPPDTDPETIRRLLKRDPKCQVITDQSEVINRWNRDWNIGSTFNLPQN
jgi:hypothetical protein